MGMSHKVLRWFHKPFKMANIIPMVERSHCSWQEEQAMVNISRLTFFFFSWLRGRSCLDRNPGYLESQRTPNQPFQQPIQNSRNHIYRACSKQ